MHAFSTSQRTVLRLGALCLVTAMSSLPVVAAPPAGDGTAADIQSRYEQERSKCLTGMSNQDRDTCLKEAGAARDAAKKGQLDEGGAAYRRNAKARCDALTGDEAKDCLARMDGKGTISGTPEAGGIYRELVTREVQPPEPAASAAPAR